MVAVSADAQALKRLRVAMKALDPASKRAVNKTLRASIEPIREEFRTEVDQVVPESGGLAAAVKRSRFVVVKRLGGTRPTLSIRIRKGKRGHLLIMNEGRLRHPVHGRPELTRKEWRWVNQTIKVGMWDRTLERSVPAVQLVLRESVQDALEATVRAAERG